MREDRLGGNVGQIHWLQCTSCSWGTPENYWSYFVANALFWPPSPDPTVIVHGPVVLFSRERGWRILTLMAMIVVYNKKIYSLGDTYSPPPPLPTPFLYRTYCIIYCYQIWNCCTANISSGWWPIAPPSPPSPLSPPPTFPHPLPIS